MIPISFLALAAALTTAFYKFSSLWYYYMKWSNQENAIVYGKHMELGSAVRLAPNVLSINCYEGGVKSIYQGGFPKPVFYFRGFAIYGTENIFTFEDNATHSARKRIISNTFSKSFVLSSPTARAATRDILFGRYLSMMHAAAAADKPLEVLQLNYAYSMDTFVQWQYGRSLSSNLLENDAERKMYLDGFFSPYPHLFWMYNFPDIARWLRRVGLYLIPKSVDEAFGKIENWNLEKCDKAHQLLAKHEQLSPEDSPVVFEQALKAMSTIDAKPSSYPKRLQIASDMFAHNSAAFETSGNTETYLFWEMCRNPDWQSKLREELCSLNPTLVHSVGTKPVEIDEIPEPKDIENLPILHAIVMETLRLWPSVPGGQPRVVPKVCSLGGYDGIPAGTIVQSYAYILHRTPEVFPDPDEWKPDRWLTATPEQLSNMKRWFWAFSSGGRMCIGSNFAFYSMKYLVATVYSNFTTSIHDHGSMELQDGYLAGPKGHRLELKFHNIG